MFGSISNVIKGRALLMKSLKGADLTFLETKPPSLC